ncbi:hypothetical protein [uncultured Tateyamaria sp.]|uniref:hypothetical protein n=1 Tax=uncultured Tateyamaria sp. TaxID=455651 RepID=UPI002625FBC1|nr:hypothetical protein [uncultured Tateyamaria sp.]
MIETTTHIRPGTIPPQQRVLNSTDAALVWVLKWAGDADHVIAAKLGTMPSKVANILSETTHVGSRDQATKMVTRPDT